MYNVYKGRPSQMIFITKQIGGFNKSDDKNENANISIFFVTVYSGINH